VHVEPHHLDQMGSIIRRLAPGRRGLTETNRTRLRYFDDRGNILALLRLPDELMRQARRHRNLRRGAVRAEMAVAIELLLMAPLRKHLLQVHTLRLSKAERMEKMAALYDFMTSERCTLLLGRIDSDAEALLDLQATEKTFHTIIGRSKACVIARSKKRSRIWTSKSELSSAASSRLDSRRANLNLMVPAPTSSVSACKNGDSARPAARQRG
jgi:hypothetical protein